MEEDLPTLVLLTPGKCEKERNPTNVSRKQFMSNQVCMVGNHNQRRTIRLKLLCPQLWYPLVRQNPIGHGHREVLLFANPSILPVGMGRVTLDFVFLGIEYSEAGWDGIKRV
jgi:hypothetical protein